jgi:hypothetical protein
MGNRRTVDIAGCAMPLQKIETIDEPRSRAAAGGNLELFEKEKKRRDDFRNRLIWGDNKLVMASLLAEFKGKIDLIYIDPPFDVGADFTMNVPIGDEQEIVGKDQSALEMVAYRDMWGKGTDSYPRKHLIRPAATFSPSDAEKGNPMGEGGVGLSPARRGRNVLRLFAFLCGDQVRVRPCLIPAWL